MSKEYNTSKTYMLNYNYFERIVMYSNSKKSESIIMYFVKIRQFLTKNQNIIYLSMTNYDKLKI